MMIISPSEKAAQCRTSSFLTGLASAADSFGDKDPRFANNLRAYVSMACRTTVGFHR